MSFQANNPLRDKSLPSWSSYLSRSTPAKHLGIVEAADAEKAIEQAIKKFDVETSRQRQLIAVRRATAR
jgi:hypothetical protein